MTSAEFKAAVEAILFASGTSVSLDRIAQALRLSEEETKKLVDSLVSDYNRKEHGIEIVKLDNSYQMVTKKAYANEIRTVMKLKRNSPLSQAALEVLAVVAYNQPVTKAFIEQVRGVDCSGVIASLSTKNLIEEKGRLELPGRPLLYGTTENFLRCFSISSLEELPPLPKHEQTEDEANGHDEPNDETEQTVAEG